VLVDQSHQGNSGTVPIFDNTKIKRLVPEYVATIPFRQGAAEIIAWYDSHPAAQKVDGKRDQLIDTMVATYGVVGPRKPGGA
jgi:hypothetical protein